MTEPGPSFAIAAAGTGGHVYPGLAVGEALVAAGIPRSAVLYVGGSRLEAEVYPDAGFPFLQVELRGLQRRLTLANLSIPAVVRRAARRVGEELEDRRVGAALGMGGYVTVPLALATRRTGVPLAVSEQNAGAGLGNRVAARVARRVFGSFPVTHGLPTAEWVGNPIRERLATFDRDRLRTAALAGWDLDPGLPIVGVFGGSLGAGVINRAVAAMLEEWSGPPVQALHLAGRGYEEMSERARSSSLRWVVMDFCREMEHFYAAADLVVARAGGSVAELTATRTPSVLVPGGFGSGGHQAANAAALARAGAAEVLDEADLNALGAVVERLVADAAARAAMMEACARLARPDAAGVIARALIEMGEG